MRVEDLGKHAFAFGLTWVDQIRKPARSEIQARRREADPSGRAPFYSVSIEHTGQYVLGFGMPAIPPRGQVYSYAATLAAAGRDGIFVAPTDDNALWFCVIRGGLVVPETDRIDSADSVRSLVERFKEALGFDAGSVFAADGTEVRGAQPFDPMSAIAGIKPVRMQRLAKGAPVGLILAIAGAAIVGFAFWHFVLHPAPKVSPEQQRAQMRAAYLTGLHSKLADYPVDPGWALRAYRSARVFPAFEAGWTLHDVTCKPSSCDAVYDAPQDAAHAVTPFEDRFGEHAVSVDREGRKLQITVALHNEPFPVNDQSVSGFKPATVSLLDWLGMLPAHIPDAKLAGQVKALNLAQTGGGTAAGFPPLYREDVTLQGRDYLGPSALNQAVRWGDYGRFRVTLLQWNPGIGTQSAWMIQFSRLHG